MKKIKFLFILFPLFSQINYAQLRVNNNGSSSSLTNNTAFLDASSSITWNNSTNNGKGLVFPRVDLTTLATMTPSTSAANFNPNRFDGMLVFNTATGTSAIGNISVTPGFYYYRNTSTSVNGGIWTPIGTGKSLLSGAVAPVNSIGVDGDFYINTQTSTLFGPKASGSWPSGTSLIGAQGTPGTQGLPGSNGLSAYQIAQNNGFSGTELQFLESLKGIQGNPGPQGSPGVTIKGLVDCAGTITQTIADTNVTATATIYVSYEDTSGDIIYTAIKNRVAGTSFTIQFGAIPSTSAKINYIIVP